MTRTGVVILNAGEASMRDRTTPVILLESMQDCPAAETRFPLLTISHLPRLTSQVLIHFVSCTG